ncbi:MAG: dUTP diphosphatase [Candidatus Margulisbacteria bacterium]|nr:dUTP diphosphatase [Candidatus Margulisiibacteriota bacterium]
MLKQVKLKIEKLEHFNGLDLPKYQTEHASGFDLVSAEDKVLKAGQRALVATGLKMEIPIGYEGQVRPRSGLAYKYGIIIPNSPGTIDADYRGEVKVIIWNSGTEDFIIKKGDRIAQFVLAPVVQADFDVVVSVDETVRGEGGFGSTGK